MPERAQKVRDERGDGGLAVGPGDADIRHPAEAAQRDLDLRVDGHAVSPRRDERRRVGRHSGAHHHRACGRDPIEVVTARSCVDAVGAECGSGRLHGVARAEVARVHRRPGAREQARRRVAAPSEPDDRDLAADRERLERLGHRIFSVESARNANMMPMIQKRTTTCVSGHPFSSK